MKQVEHRCWFCNRPIEQGQAICDRDECQEFDRELEAADRQYQRAELIKAVKSAVRIRCKHDEEYGLNRLQRWFYTVKLLICVIIRNRRYQKDGEEYPVRVSCYHYSDLYAGWECRDIVVGHGFLKGWFYNLEEDGDWCM